MIPGWHRHEEYRDLGEPDRGDREEEALAEYEVALAEAQAAIDEELDARAYWGDEWRGGGIPADSDELPC